MVNNNAPPKPTTWSPFWFGNWQHYPVCKTLCPPLQCYPSWPFMHFQRPSNLTTCTIHFVWSLKSSKGQEQMATIPCPYSHSLHFEDLKEFQIRIWSEDFYLFIVLIFYFMFSFFPSLRVLIPHGVKYFLPIIPNNFRLIIVIQLICNA